MGHSQYMPPVVQEPLRHAAEFKAFSRRILAARVPKQPRLGQSKKNFGNDSTTVMKSLHVTTSSRNYLESGMMIKPHLALTAQIWANLRTHSGRLNQAPDLQILCSPDALCVPQWFGRISWPNPPWVKESTTELLCQNYLHTPVNCLAMENESIEDVFLLKIVMFHCRIGIPYRVPFLFLANFLQLPQRFHQVLYPFRLSKAPTQTIPLPIPLQHEVFCEWPPVVARTQPNVCALVIVTVFNMSSILIFVF